MSWKTPLRASSFVALSNSPSLVSLPMPDTVRFAKAARRCTKRGGTEQIAELIQCFLALLVWTSRPASVALTGMANVPHASIRGQHRSVQKKSSRPRMATRAPLETRATVSTILPAGIRFTSRLPQVCATCASIAPGLVPPLLAQSARSTGSIGRLFRSLMVCVKDLAKARHQAVG